MSAHEDRCMSTDQLPFADSQEHQRLEASLRESEMLRELSALLASSLDIEHILYVLVKRTTQVCEVERCSVWLFEETPNLLRPKTYHLEAKQLDHHLVEAADRLWYHTPLSMEDPAIHQLFAGQGILYVQDLRSVPTLRSVADTFFVRSVLLVGLIREGRPVGMLSLDDPGKIRTFSPEQMQLARAIGQQAAIAIDNARLYQQARADRRRAEQLIDRMRSIYQVALTVNASEEVAPAFTVAIEHLVRGLEADSGMIALLDSGKLHRVSSTGVEVAYAPQEAPVPLDQMPNCYLAATTGNPVFITENQAKAGEIAWFRDAGFQDVMIVPLMVRAHSSGQAMSGAVGQMLDPKPAETHKDVSLPDRCVGLAFVNFHHPHTMPTRGQFAFAQDIAAQCALAAEKHQLLTEAQRAAEVANERANTLDAIFHAMTEGITVSDMQGNVLVLNNAASHFLGVPKNFRNHLTSFLRRYPTYTVDGQLISEQDFPLARALKGERIRAERFVTRRADGEERILEINIAPLRDIQGQQVGMVSAFRDITESIRAEQRIRQALDTMLHVAEAVSGITDIKTILRSVLERTLITLNCSRGAVYLLDESQEKFLPLLSIGFSSQAEQRWLDELATWLNPTPDQSHDFFQQLLAGHPALINEEQYPYQPNPPEHLNVLAAPIKHNKHVHGLLLLDRSPQYGPEEHERGEFGTWDITVLDGIAELAGLAVEQAHWQHEAIDARTSEEDMRRANELKDEFIAITAHEFRTPLTIILAQTQLVERSLTSLANQVTDRGKIERAIKNLAIVEEQTRQLTDIVKTFLEVSQINRGQLALNLAEVDLSEIARQVVEQHSTHSEQHIMRCDIEPGRQPWLVKGDRARLQQIIANLVENAIKYSPLGGPVTVHLRHCRNDKEGKNLIEVCVEDKGIGIPPEFQAHLFERFYRAPSSVESKTKGIGLGLYIVAQLIQKQGGTIRVESSGVFGEGSRFIFTLPALESTNQA
jgi:PAS domain S-box-containing protein